MSIHSVTPADVECMVNFLHHNSLEIIEYGERWLEKRYGVTCRTKYHVVETFLKLTILLAEDRIEIRAK